ncbi:MAG: iron chelate uptake ABC transporter family permease subunit, partial [Bacteroidota bacterium]
MESLIDFILLKDPNVRWVVLGVVLIASSSAVVGVFAFLRKRGLVGDAISHSILPGICLAFMLTGVKNPLMLMIGAFLSGWFSIWVIGLITRQSRIKSDAAIALVLSVFYGFGILLLTIIQQSGNARQAGLDKFLFGKAASLVYDDVMIFGAFALALLLLVYLFFNAFRLVIFDKDFARARGFPVDWIEVILSSLTVLAITIGIQTVGVVLMVALLISPAATARYWTHNLGTMTLLAAFFGGLSGLFGAYVSYEWPRMPTGPWVVSFLS